MNSHHLYLCHLTVLSPDTVSYMLISFHLAARSETPLLGDYKAD